MSLVGMSALESQNLDAGGIVDIPTDEGCDSFGLLFFLSLHRSLPPSFFLPDFPPSVTHSLMMSRSYVIVFEKKKIPCRERILLPSLVLLCFLVSVCVCGNVCVVSTQLFLLSVARESSRTIPFDRFSCSLYRLHDC